jgi:branched-chain amino acid transport system substrate-binding protein
MAGAAPVQAQEPITVGAILSLTGPAAALGIPERNTLKLATASSEGPLQFKTVVLDDHSDTTGAVKAAHKLISDDHVDVIIGPSTTPDTLAIIETVSRSGTPMISLGASSKIVKPPEKRHWIFKIPYNDVQEADKTAKDMASRGVKTPAYIGFDDAYGNGWREQIERAAKANGIKMVAEETYDPRDTSVTAQVLKVIAAHPDAVLIGASGTPAALPETTLQERGYQGRIYQTAGVISNQFLRLGGKALDGTILAGGPFVVAAQLPEGNPIKKPAARYRTVYEGAYGKGSLTTFGANAWDAILLLRAAVPVAEATGAKPGTAKFRSALRDAIEGIHGLPTALGIVNMAPNRHLGLSSEAPVMIEIKNGTWSLAK